MVQDSPEEQPEETAAVQRQFRWDLKQVAVAGFLAGVFLHACVIMSVLDAGNGGGISDDVEVRPVGTAGPSPLATPTVLADRTNCAEIRGTDYRSQSERQWFIANCSS